MPSWQVLPFQATLGLQPHAERAYRSCGVRRYVRYARSQSQEQKNGLVISVQDKETDSDFTRSQHV